MKTPQHIKPASGKLGVLIVGLGGAVSSTFVIGVLSVRKGLAKPVGSLTQLAYLETAEGRKPIREAVPLAALNDIVFGGWDIFPETVYEGALHAGVLTKDDIEKVADEVQAIRPMRACFDPRFVTRLNGTWCMPKARPIDWVENLRADIRAFKATHGCDRLVVVWAASTEAYLPASSVHEDLARFEAELQVSDTAAISPSMCYAYAALKEGVPFINGAPALTVDFPAMQALAEAQHLPIAGKDFKSGQTMMKTVLGEAFRARMLGLSGWFSTNILGNRDGEVLDDPQSFKTKEVSKLSVLDSILSSQDYPDLYGDIYHKVRINYYPPRGDNKEAWDNIDIFGWMGYPMQIKVNFLCRDSILAAPLVLDLVLLMDLAQRAGYTGIQRWLSFYFKSPMHRTGETPLHAFFEQETLLHDHLRALAEAPVSAE